MTTPLVTAPAIPPETTHPLFFFGTLLEPAVVSLVTGRRVAAADLLPASLAGFRRVRVRGKSYPTLVPHAGAVVAGVLWLPQDVTVIPRLNAYEGPGYLAELHLVTDADGKTFPAWVYRTRAEHLQPSDEPWDLETWRAGHLAAFLAQGEALVGDGPW